MDNKITVAYELKHGEFRFDEEMIFQNEGHLLIQNGGKFYFEALRNEKEVTVTPYELLIHPGSRQDSMPDTEITIERLESDIRVKAYGAEGANGRDGQNGENGCNGQNGENGTKERPGTDGKDGKDGTDGQNGANGDNGGRTPRVTIVYDTTGPFRVELVGDVIKGGGGGKGGKGGIAGKGGKGGEGGLDIDGEKTSFDGRDGRDGRDGYDGFDGADRADGQFVIKDINTGGVIL